jgi:hypothetical protein
MSAIGSTNGSAAPAGQSSKHIISESYTERRNAYLQTIFHGARA